MRNIMLKNSLILACMILIGACSNSSRKEEQLARELLKSVLTCCEEQDGSVKPAEAISAMAAVVGERCIDAAGEYKVQSHPFVPGQRVFSDGINVLLCGDNGNYNYSGVPSKSVFGILRDRLADTSYKNEFPDMGKLFEDFAGGIGNPEGWGKVPLTIPEGDRPLRLPLRIAFDSRSRVDEAMKSLNGDKAKALRVSTVALALLLKDMRGQIAPDIALKLALETVNGMAKTAPMMEAIDTPTEAMREAQHKVFKTEHRKKG